MPFIIVRAQRRTFLSLRGAQRRGNPAAVIAGRTMSDSTGALDRHASLAMTG